MKTKLKTSSPFSLSLKDTKLLLDWYNHLDETGVWDEDTDLKNRLQKHQDLLLKPFEEAPVVENNNLF